MAIDINSFEVCPVRHKNRVDINSTGMERCAFFQSKRPRSTSSNSSNSPPRKSTSWRSRLLWKNRARVRIAWR